VLRVDPATGRVVARVPAVTGGSRLQAIAASAGGIWVAHTGSEAVLRLDPASGRIALLGRGGLWLHERRVLALERLGRTAAPAVGHGL
jgi:hypothetical protein